jgi:hypothetical protein
LLSVSPISTSIRDESASELASVTVEISDTDDTIKTMLASDHIAGSECQVIQSIGGTDILVLVGRLGSDFRWEEGDRKVVFTIDTAFVNAQLGFSPSREDFPAMARTAEGKMWPIVFGSCLKVPALRVIEHIHGKLSSTLNSATSSILVENGEQFRQGMGINLRFRNGLILGGSMSGNTFTISEYNKADATVTIAARPAGDDDYSNSYVLWVTLPAKMSNKYCLCNGLVNYCYRQEGQKCWFSKPWKAVGSSTLLNLPTGGYTSIETCSFVRANWPVPYQAEQKQGSDWIITRTVKANTVTFYPGEECYDDSGTPTYVCSDYGSTIKGVYAYRTIDNIRSLQPVPSSYYSKVTSTLAGRMCTYLTFDRQIEDREGENWESGVYVTQTGSVPCGNNTAAILQWLLNQTDIPIDAASFAEVQTAIASYPSNFALTESSDILSLCADIAYQARLGLSISTTAKLRYLSRDTTALASIYNESTILHNTLALGLTDPNDVVTNYNAKWRPSYDQDWLLLTYKRNIDKYGERKGEREYWIYNHETQVTWSATFWFNRLCDMWFTANFTTGIHGLKEEAFDCTGIALHSVAQQPGPAPGTFVANMIRGTLLSSTYDSDTDTVQLGIHLASRLGGLAEDLTFFTGSPAVGAGDTTDPTSGIVEVDYAVYTGDTQNSPNGQYYQQEPETEFIVTVTNPAPKRDDYFTLSVSGGIPNATYTVSIVTTDVAEQLHNSGGQLTSALMDANGTYTQSVRFRSGTAALNPVRIVLTRLLASTDTHQSEQMFVVGASTGTGKNVAFVGIVTNRSSDTSYTLTVYPDYPTLTPAWSITATKINNGGYRNQTATDTYVTVIGKLKANMPGTSATDYDYVFIEDLLPDINTCYVGIVSTKISGNVYNVVIYPEYPSSNGLRTVSVTQLQGKTTSTIPAGTYTLVTGVLKKTSGAIGTNYDYFMQVPVWL